MSCIFGIKGGSDEISQTVTSAIVALAMDWDYNFSKFIFEEMKSNLLGKKKDLFLMYPRLLQMIFKEKYPQIEMTPDILDMKALGPNTFGLMKQSRKSAKVAYQGLKDSAKFGKFADIEDTPAVVSINVEGKRHNGAIFHIDTLTDGCSHNRIIANCKEASPFLSLLNLHLKSNPKDSANALLPRKRKRRDSTSGLFIMDLVQKKYTLTEPKIQRSFPEPIPMDHDFQSPIVEEEVIPSEGAQASGSSFETPKLEISKGKCKLPKFEFFDVIQLQNRVFDLEQNFRLFQNFGDEFQPLSVEGENITASSSGPANPPSQSSSERAARPNPDANLDTFLYYGPLSAQDRREKKIRIAQLKGKMLLMKNSDQNVLGDHHEMFFGETEKKFIDKYGDRSGIVM
uniref:Uncharacterized protein n=1 Tax=Lactuca sativa TaxID=4236 RepID=A0A9R1VR18_LACSA|nr:hypothetical protein LSAT_V11C400178800 [Lactuca sativa]